MADLDTNALGKLIGEGIRETQNVKEEGFGSQQYGFNQITPIDNIYLLSDTTIVSQQLIGSAFILGHSVNGRLSNASYTLGSGGLGSKTTKEIVNANKTFTEDFGISTFIDSPNTTASISTTAFECEFGATSQELRTSTIYYYPDHPMTAITLFVTGDNVDKGTYYVSGNGGSSWTNVDLGISASMTVGSDVRIKVVNVGTSGSGFPTAFGTWGVAGTNYSFTITRLKAVYEV